MITFSNDKALECFFIDWLLISLNSPEIKSSLDFWTSFMVFVNDNSEGLPNHWRIDCDFSFKLDSIIPYLTCLVPLSSVMRCPGAAILGCLERNSIYLSLLGSTAAVTSFLQRHGRYLKVLLSWHVHLEPHSVLSLTWSIVESRSGIESWFYPVVVPLARLTVGGSKVHHGS